MSSKMLIDAAHPEETRVVVLKGHRVEEFDFEAADKKQLRGNIYLAKVTRVEPSLQAAFIEYGGNRHGFLAFSEIHPDYYQIPFADRQALLEEEARAHRDEDDEGRGGEGRHHGGESRNHSGEGRNHSGEGRNHSGEGRGQPSERRVHSTEGRGSAGGESRGGEHRGGEGRGQDNRGHRRSRRHRRDGAVSALGRRGPVGEAVSEPVPYGEEPAQESLKSWEDVPPHPEAQDEAHHHDQEPELTEGGTAAGPALAPAIEAATAEAPAEGLALVPAERAAPLSPEAADSLAEAKADEPPDAGEATPSAPAPATASAETPAPEAAFAGEDDAEDDHEHEHEHEHEEDDEDEEDADGRHAQEGHDRETEREDGTDTGPALRMRAEENAKHRIEETEEDSEPDDEVVEQIGGDALEDAVQRAPRPRRHHYKIQEVIKRRQILLIQVVKEERGNKGAALTTYLSLAGRYSVLMPNTARGGGISRKITDAEDRKRLKAIVQELEVPEGMGIILRTAGAARSKIEVKRDFEYLLRMWESVRELTLRSTAPTLVYEEGSLIKRSIRDLYTKDVEDVIVSGEAGFHEAREFMRLLMPGAAKSVQLYRDPQPIFAKCGAEAQLDAMFSNHVTLKSGGYLVINQTEALVAIDVNSGRSTREHNIEDTALRTNLEAADEIARQLRLRDLAGLIVVDFIDMDESRNNRSVERRIKEALKNDRARIQIGRISHFGLLEMSRQRMRTGVLEGSTVSCPHCAGSGTVRSTASIALHVLRLVEDALIRDSSHNPIIRTRSEVALYILNQKRAKLLDLETRFGVTITVAADHTLTGTVYHAFERGEPATPALVLPSAQNLIRVDSFAPIFEEGSEGGEEETEDGEDEGAETEASEQAAGDREFAPGETNADGSRRRKRRRRRRGRDRESSGEIAHDAPQPSDEGLVTMALIGGDLSAPPIAAAEESAAAEWAEAPAEAADAAAEPEAEPDAPEVEARPSEESVEGAPETHRLADLAPLTAEVVVEASVVEETVATAPIAAGAPEPGEPPAAAAAGETPAVEAPIETLEAIEPPRRRRSRRSARSEDKPGLAEAVAGEASGEAGEAEAEVVAEDAGPSPKRARRGSRSRAAEVAAPVPAPAEGETKTIAAAAMAEEAAPQPIAEAAPPQAVEPEAAQPEAAAVDAAEAPQPPEQPAPDRSAAAEPDRPKRSGWWQRARASFGS